MFFGLEIVRIAVMDGKYFQIRSVIKERVTEEITSFLPPKIGSAKYSLILAIEGAVDLFNHIIAKNEPHS